MSKISPSLILKLLLYLKSKSQNNDQLPQSIIVLGAIFIQNMLNTQFSY